MLYVIYRYKKTKQCPHFFFLKMTSILDLRYLKALFHFSLSPQVKVELKQDVRCL